jgi:hypothetical protein
MGRNAPGAGSFNISSFRGASAASEPGIQTYGLNFWIPGSRSARLGMTT